MALPATGKPTAAQVVTWARDLANRRAGVDVDGYYGYQCWDLPNYILKKYWGFVTWGNANAMANQSNYRGHDFKIYRNTPSFIPQPGDWAVWAGSNPGHVNIVVGPSSTTRFWAVDQNWNSPNSFRGYPAQLINHTYDGVTHFVRPPYKAEPKPAPTPTPTSPKPATQPSTPKPVEKAPEQPIFKDVTKVIYTLKRDDFGQRDKFEHRVAWGRKRQGKVKGITVKNAHTMRSVHDLYNDRNQYINTSDYPHYYVDYTGTWSPRDEAYEVPDDSDNIVIEICGDYVDDRDAFFLSEFWAIMLGWEIFEKYNLKFDYKSLKVDDAIWRSLKEHVNWDFVKNGFPSQEKLEELAKVLAGLYANKKALLANVGSEKITKSKIKTVVKNAETVVKPNAPTSTPTPPKPATPTNNNPKIIIEKSNYTFAQALNLQMLRGMPMKSVSGGWIHATRQQTSDAMNTSKIWGDATQRYQMLNLGKYQGVPVAKLNQILSGKGTLHNQGQAFADACKKYDLNEIYLIAHAFLESGYGKSNFASGRYGIYNFFGIGAFDSNPNNAITFARSQGWTTASKGIIGGAKFVREGYINKGQNTLYRMRWNPKNPATHQYATAIEWCQHQATTIANLYKQIGLQGVYYTQDQYK
ncbi:glucosaminidase domain-containing protein [Staphylococcus americanisciuri]|uniref:Glucosaminidase domain-containing protein n=1 Tax=Staphylococcus americanisciuri TaxID=2973940 RepID=A0ABT2F4S7_9STAP|nr:glucosaminidase domain-containing protein [Staphylococcus americanisciuri]MCS4487183.1 glucosaminidase domain-containing protein [Staphylococcus americanisciuri]